MNYYYYLSIFLYFVLSVTVIRSVYEYSRKKYKWKLWKMNQDKVDSFTVHSSYFMVTDLRVDDCFYLKEFFDLFPNIKYFEYILFYDKYRASNFFTSEEPFITQLIDDNNLLVVATRKDEYHFYLLEKWAGDPNNYTSFLLFSLPVDNLLLIDNLVLIKGKLNGL